MVMLDSSRRGARVPTLARWLLGLGIAATLAANVAHGPGHGPVGAAVAAWPAVALATWRPAIRATLHVGQPRAQLVRTYLATLTAGYARLLRPRLTVNAIHSIVNRVARK